MYDTKETMYTDQTGKFPHRSMFGNKYQMILHKIDVNSTWIEPMKNKTEGKAILDRRPALDRKKYQCKVPKNQVIDNKIPASQRTEIKATNTTFQIVPPDDHHRNLADKAIHIWKDHFIGVMRDTGAYSPIHLLCQEIPQAERKLLLPRQSNVNPNELIPL